MSQEREDRILAVVNEIALDMKSALSGGEVDLSNTIEFSDDTYIYFVADVSTGGWQVNRYGDSVVLTKATGTGNRPNDVPSLQSLNYI